MVYTGNISIISITLGGIMPDKAAEYLVNLTQKNGAQ